MRDYISSEELGESGKEVCSREYWIPVAGLTNFVDRMNTCWENHHMAPITKQEIYDAISNKYLEFQPWCTRDIAPPDISDEEQRIFHIRRIATLALDFPPEPITVIVISMDDTPEVTINDGNHRTSAAKVNGLEFIKARVVSYGIKITDVFPEAIEVKKQG